ncbi:MAG: hypothetical protein L0Z50_14270 [Verrucomicrobiales bacterium]|nr:hypothetical protein [Verrucomicrobiales bacterium]
MCYFLRIELLPHEAHRLAFDLTENRTLDLIYDAARKCRLDIRDISGFGGLSGGTLELAEQNQPCSCGIVSEHQVDTRILDFAMTLAPSIRLAGVRIVWLWSDSAPQAERTMTFEEFEERNSTGQLVDNTPYRLCFKIP